MSNSKIRIGKNTKLKSFLLFLLLATLFWFLAKFSKEYTATVSAKLNYTNIPSNTLLSKDNREEVSFDLFANGFEFLFFKLKKPIVDVPVSKYYENGDKQIQINAATFSRLVLEELNNKNDLHNLSIDTLIIKLNAIIQKKVPVRAILDVSFKEGFKQLGQTTTKPDSIMLTGPAVALDSLLFIKTVPVYIEDVETDLKLTMAILEPKNSEIQYEPKSVQASMDVGEFTQKRLQIPIELTNVPSEIRLKLIPESIPVVFNVSLENFKKISTRDFKLSCDYNDRNQSENFMLPKLLKKPANIYDLELEIKKVDFLIFK